MCGGIKMLKHNVRTTLRLANYHCCKNVTRTSNTRQVKRTQMVATAKFTIRVFVTFSDCYEQWRSQPKNLGGSKMFDFRRVTLCCFEKRLSKHKTTVCSKYLGGHGPFGSPWLRIWLRIECMSQRDRRANGCEV